MYRLYNIFAELCSYIINTCSEDFFVKYSCISLEERHRMNAVIQTHLGELFSSDGQIRQLSPEDCTPDFFTRLNSLITSLQSQPDYFAIVGLTQVLDESLADILLQAITSFQKDDFSVVLNTNRELTGIGLLPRCSCAWERKRRLSHCYNRMDNFLFNILLMENKILGELIDKHFFLSPSLFPSFKKNKKLKIAATALRLEAGFTIAPYSDKKVQYFSIEYDNSQFSKNNELIWQKIMTAAANKSDIIVFPEMLGNPQTESFVTTRLKKLSEEEKNSVPSLIILPSVWQNRYNTVSILDRNGNILCRQSKQNPFRAEKDGDGYLEGILSSLVVNIFHYEGIGRIAILICKDFLTTRYMEQLMRCFKLTLIIVPSFSTGSYDFRQSFDLCAHDDCNVIWINTCAAMEPGKESNFENIGYVRKRISRFDDEAQRLKKMPACEGAFKGQCSHDCIFYETIQGV